MKVYIDSDYKCHTQYSNGLIEVETSFFDGKCDTYIEGYRFIPNGYSWTDIHGIIYNGEIAFPFKKYFELEYAQREYEKELAEVAKILLGV